MIIGEEYAQRTETLVKLKQIVNVGMEPKMSVLGMTIVWQNQVIKTVEY